MGFHFQDPELQALFRAGKKLGYNVLQHDLVFALLQGLRQVRVSCNHADAGLAGCCDNIILLLAHEWEGGGDRRKLSAFDGVYGIRPSGIDAVRKVPCCAADTSSLAPLSPTYLETSVYQIDLASSIWLGTACRKVTVSCHAVQHCISTLEDVTILGRLSILGRWKNDSGHNIVVHFQSVQRSSHLKLLPGAGCALKASLNLNRQPLGSP